MNKNKKRKIEIKRLILYASMGLGMIGFLVLHLYVSGYLDKKSHIISYAMFKKDASAGKLGREGVISGYEIKGKYKSGKEFQSNYGVNDKDVQTFLDKNADKVDYRFVYQRGTDWSKVTEALLVIAAIIVGLWFLLKLLGKAQRSSVAGKTRLVTYDKEGRNQILFSDVAGVNEAKEEVAEIVDFLKDPDSFTALGARPPTGVLLFGPPGNGKTLLARAVAGEANVPFYSISGSEFVEMFVGVGAKRVRDVYEKARKNSPCIIFIDEFDGVGRKRSSTNIQNHNEIEQTLNQLLVEMDGFERNAGIVLIAATNRHEILDPALLRPGRLDRMVFVDHADINGREKILEIHTRNKKMADSVDLRKIAERSSKFSGADLEGLANEAAIRAARNKQTAIEQADFEYALEKKYMGKKINKEIIEEERKILAYHEAGHAIVGLSVFERKRMVMYKVTICPSQNGALGFAAFFDTEERYMLSKRDLENHILMLLGGRAAEFVEFDGNVTTGAANDLERATELQDKIIGSFGMDKEFGLAVFKEGGQNWLLGGSASGSEASQETASLKTSLIRKHLETAYEKTKDILVKNRDALRRLAEALLESETLDKEQVEKIVGKLE